MTTIPIAPTIPTIPLPSRPAINLPIAPSISLVEPPITDPTGSLRAFTYARYGSAINSLLTEMLEWDGDSVLAEAEYETAADEVMIEMVKTHKKIKAEHGMRGFKFMSGAVKTAILDVEIDARHTIQKATVASFAQQAEWAKQFVAFAYDAGIKDVRYATDENKNFIYANMAKVEEIANNLLEMQQEQVAVFTASAKLYESKMQAVKTELLTEEIKVMDFSSRIESERLNLKNDKISLDAKHAENTGTIINNADQILQAKDCLNLAEIEKLKVLQTHAVLNKYLTEIKQAHTSLVLDRADVEKIASDLDRYEKEGKLIESESRSLMDQTSAEQQTLNQMYKLSMSQIQKAKTEIRAFEEGLRSSEIDTKITSEEYKQTLSSVLIANENIDMTTVGDNANLLDAWTGVLSDTYSVINSLSSAQYSAERAKSSGHYAGAQTESRGYGQYQRAYASSKASTQMTLTQIIS